MIVFPAIDIQGGKAVRLRRGDFDDVTVFGDDPVELARHWQAEGAEALHVVDLDAARTGELVNFDIVERIVKAVDIPVQYGGGIRGDKSLALMAGIGVHWVVMGTAAVTALDLLDDAVNWLGERLVVGVDCTDGMVATHGWQQRSQMSAIRFAKLLGEHGVRRIVYTDTARDGMLGGPNLLGLRDLAEVSPLEIVLSGGVGTARRPAAPQAHRRRPPWSASSSAARSTRRPSRSPRRRPSSPADGGAVVHRKRRHPVPRRPRRARGQGRQLRRPARRRRPGRAGRALRRRGRRRARLPRHHRLARAPRHHRRARGPLRRAGLHPVHDRRRPGERGRRAPDPRGRRRQGHHEHGRRRGPRPRAALRRALRCAVHRGGDRRASACRGAGKGRRRRAGRSTCTAAARQRASTRWPGRCARPSWAPASSCSRAWTATAPSTATTSS